MILQSSALYMTRAYTLSEELPLGSDKKRVCPRLVSNRVQTTLRSGAYGARLQASVRRRKNFVAIRALRRTRAHTLPLHRCRNLLVARQHPRQATFLRKLACQHALGSTQTPRLISLPFPIRVGHRNEALTNLSAIRGPSQRAEKVSRASTSHSAWQTCRLK